MIRINLIQPVKQEVEPKAREAAPSLAQRKEIYPLASLVICLAVVGLIYWISNYKINQLNSQIAVERQEAARLAGIQAQNVKYQGQLAQINEHIQLIQTLEQSRTGPQALMAQLGNAVNRTNGLYLLSVDASKDRLAIHGQSDHVNAIADFIATLESLQSFNDVQLRQVFEDDQSSRVSFKFDLDCLYRPPVEAPPPPAPPAGLKGRQPGR